jgi:pimeloyl-ACP methyl ester carboxylesterase
MATYVLLHGGAAGSWIWKYCVQALRRNGHDVHTVTFTGFAERRHLISPFSTVETHVVDVLNTLEFEEISDCILVAYSYSGSVAPGVVAAAAKRIRKVVYLDAIVVRQGETVSESMGYMNADQARAVAAGVRTGAVPIYSQVAEQQRAEAKQKPYKMSPERQAWLLEHLSNMPTACAVNPVAVGAEAISVPVEYIAVSDTIMKPMHERARKLGWNIHEVKGDHAILVGDPDTTVRMLEKFA